MKFIYRAMHAGIEFKLKIVDSGQEQSLEVFFEQSIPYFTIVYFRKLIAQEVNTKLASR